MPRKSSQTICSGETESHRDLRSHSHAVNRQSKQSAKYYGYRGVHPSWIDQAYFSLEPSPTIPYYGPFHSRFYPSCAPLVAYPGHVRVSTWTKHDMWMDRDTAIWPLDRRHHTGKKIREKRSWKWNEIGLGRKMKQKARRLASAVQGAEIEPLDPVGYYHRLFVDEMDEEYESRVGLDDLDEAAAAGTDGAPLTGDACDVPSDVEVWSSLAFGHAVDAESEDEDGFHIVSDRDFDVVSMASMGDEYGPT